MTALVSCEAPVPENVVAWVLAILVERMLSNLNTFISAAG